MREVLRTLAIIVAAVFGADNQEIARFAVPSSGDGYFWDVFSFQGADPSKLTVLQSLGSRPNPYDEYTQTCSP